MKPLGGCHVLHSKKELP